ncbi:hypothetical protein [Thiorhodovibrio winogradskyi]|nr:hypothetical protein [Thiorhodovibrio winogradskyi]
MQEVRSSCQPRPEILAGTFNPEIFTASLSRVLGDYARGEAREGAASLYSDPVAFFRDATYPTQGLRDILDNVLARLVRNDAARPGMQRLDEAFGGGKTHTLIAVTHAAKQGQDVAPYLDGIVGKNAGPTGGGSGGLHLESTIIKQLSDEGELITTERATTAETLTLVGKLFFDTDAQVAPRAVFPLASQGARC